MADPLDYTLVRMDDNIQDKAVLTYDAANDKITDSGLKAAKGELEANAGTVSVGLQDMSSAGEQVIWTNRASKVNYAPPWHVLDEVNPGGSSDRFYDPIQVVTRFAIKTDVLENPTFNVHVPVHEVVFRLVMDFPEANDDVQFIVSPTSDTSERIWDEFFNVSAGTNTLVLDKPIAFHPGDYVFTIKPYGDVNLAPPVKVMGDAQTGRVGYDVHFREFTEKPLATQEYVIATVTGGPADDVMLKSVYDKGKDGKVDVSHLTDKVRGADSAGNSKYYGTNSSGTSGFFELPEGVDESALKADIKANANTAKANTDEIAKHETAINGHGVQLASHAGLINTNTKNIKVAMDLSESAMNEGLQNRKNAVNAVVAEVSSVHKTITLKLMSTAGLVDSALIDLSSWFSGGTPPQPGDDHKIYYGFTIKTTLPEDEILRIGTTKEVSTIDSLDVTLTRSSQVPNYMWIWLPDSAGTIKGFDFSGFVSQWGSVAINVAGVDGKLYVSPNKTSATSIEFEVKV